MSSPPSALSSSSSLNAPAVIAVCCVLVMLHLGRDVLQPIALAAILSLAAAPLIRSFGRLGLRQGPALLAGLLAGVIGLATVGATLASQLLDVSSELPQYRAAVAQKATQLRILAEQPFAHVKAGLEAVAPLTLREQGATVRPPVPDAATPDLAHLLNLAWGPVGETGLVLVLLLFILLEQQGLQDRLIRLAGHTEVSRTVRALAEAANGVSRYFFCQTLINATFGTAVGLALWAIGLPHALLWGALSCVLRFLPYVGAMSAGAIIACFAAATSSGWTLALSCLLLFGSMEIIVANLVEPRLVGHSTGLSPLAVVISAVFWGTLWGPVGLLLSTPLTVCLVVAGRHVPALAPLAVLLGKALDVTAAQRFFRRALTGESAEIVRDAALFLRRAPLARYCDQVLLPGLALASTELHLGQIDGEQQQRLRRTIADLAETLAPGGAAPAVRRSWRHQPGSLIDSNIGAHLRRLREQRQGRWQGSFDVPQASIVLCAGLPTERDELVSELLARALRETGIDARSTPLPLPHEEHLSQTANLICTVFLPCPLARTFETWRAEVAVLRSLLPDALLVAIRLPDDESRIWHGDTQAHMDAVLHSFEECVAFTAREKRGEH